MTKSKPASKNKPKRQSKRLKEARQIIEEYANDLRKFMDKLRRKPQ